MTPLDRLLQRWRLAKARPWIPTHARLLDIGTADGVAFRRWPVTGVGIDPDAPSAHLDAGVRLVQGMFPVDLPGEVGPFDAAMALAVLEHLDDDDLGAWERNLHDLVRPGGRFVATVPHPLVDKILHVLIAVRLIDGMHTHEHHGFDVAAVTRVFTTPRWRLVRRARFQLGLNHLFVFERS